MLPAKRSRPSPSFASSASASASASAVATAAASAPFHPSSLSLDPSQSPVPKSSTATCFKVVSFGSLSDIDLVYGSTRFQCHRFALAARSPVFEAMLQDKEAKCVSIPEQRRPDGLPVSAEDFEIFLRFLYFPEHYLGLAVLNHKMTNTSVDSILHLSHYFQPSVRVDSFFLPLVQVCPTNLKETFWQLLLRAEANRITNITATLAEHHGKFHRFYSSEAETAAQNPERVKYFSQLSKSTQLQLIEAQVTALRTELHEILAHYETELAKLAYATNLKGWFTVVPIQQMPVSAPTVQNVFAALKAKIEEAARL